MLRADGGEVKGGDREDGIDEGVELVGSEDTLEVELDGELEAKSEPE